MSRGRVEASRPPVELPKAIHPQHRKKRQVLRVIWIELGANLLVAGGKIVIGRLTRNLTVISDGFHGLLDASNNVVGLVGMRYAYEPPDANHPYGHRKIEAIMALAIGGVMALTSWEILQAIFRRWFTQGGTPPAAFNALFVLALVATGIINTGVSLYELRQGRKLKSTFLIADATHTRTHVAMDVLALASLCFAGAFPWLDSLLATIVVAYLVRAGWIIVRDNAMILTDAVRMDVEPIRRVAESVEGVKNCHAIRSHGMPDDVHLDLHIVVDGDLSAEAAQAIETRVRDALFEKFPDVTEVAIHHQTLPPHSEQPRPVRRE